MRNLIVASLLLLPPIVSGKAVSLSLGSGYAKAGWTVDLPVTLAGGAQPAALQWSFNYSKDITSVTVVAGGSSKAAGKTITCSGNTCLVFGVNTATLADGVVAVATFQIAPKPSSATIEIVVNGAVAAEANGSPIPATGGTGKITLPSAASQPGLPDLQAGESQLKFYAETADLSYMERRLHPRAQVQYETKVTNLRTRESGLGQTCDISESGISVMQPVQMVAGDPVQLEMADSILTGRAAYSNPEGGVYRLGIEVQRVQLGHSNLSNLLQRTLVETMPSLPGVEYAESQLS
jgi:PilZ domain-containing protein